MTDEAYNRVVHGGLKLKGAPAKDRKRKSMENDTSTSENSKLSEQSEDGRTQVPTGSTDQGHEADHTELTGTAAEKSFKMVQMKRQKTRINRQLEMTHRERMEKLNAHLATLSEHFDIPKVGPG